MSWRLLALCLSAGALVSAGCARRVVCDEPCRRLTVDSLEARGRLPQDPIAQEREALLWRSDDRVAGTVEEIGPGYLVVQPYMPLIGRTVLLVDEEAPVFAAGARVGLATLRPGLSVQVFFRRPDPTGLGRPRAIGVEVLSEREAGEIRERYSDVPIPGGRSGDREGAQDVKHLEI